MNLKYSQDAVEDLIRLREFIALNNPGNAINVSRKILQSIGNILNSPLIGKILEQYTEEIRELVIGRYIFRYLVDETEITILRIWHTREIK